MDRHRNLAVRTATALIIIFSLSTQVKASRLHQEDGILTNHSAEYVRTLNRNTSTDPDAAFYNPAGLAYMPGNGLFISFSSQTYYVEKIHNMDFYALEKEGAITAPPHKQPWFRDCLIDEYKAKLTAPVLPGLDIIWKDDKWAAYFDLAVMQAALDMTYYDGLAVMDWGNLLAEEITFPETSHLIQFTRDAEAVRNEMYLGFTFGGAYSIENWISAGGGLRIIYAQGNMTLNITNANFLVQDTAGGQYSIEEAPDWDVDTDSSGIGYGIIMSTHIKPEGLVSALKGLDATFRFEYYPPMEIEKKTNKFVAPVKTEASGSLDIFKDGTPNPGFDNGNGYYHGNGTKTLTVTYPSTLNFGLSYIIFDWIKLNSSSQISLRQMRKLDDGREKDYTYGYQVGFGVEFFVNEKITLSTGYLYNDFGIKPDKRSEADPLLSSHTLGGGAGFRVDDRLSVNVGMFYQYFVPATVHERNYIAAFGKESWSYITKDLDEKRFSTSIGVTYRLSDEGSNSGDREKGKSETDMQGDQSKKTGSSKGSKVKL